MQCKRLVGGDDNFINSTNMQGMSIYIEAKKVKVEMFTKHKYGERAYILGRTDNNTLYEIANISSKGEYNDFF
jgi:hypothetical protein